MGGIGSFDIDDVGVEEEAVVIGLCDDTNKFVPSLGVGNDVDAVAVDEEDEPGAPCARLGFSGSG
jgi:hypothetical protein